MCLPSPATTDAPAPQAETIRANARPKRKQQNITEEVPAAKKTRIAKAAEESESSGSSIATVQMLSALNELESDLGMFCFCCPLYIRSLHLVKASPPSSQEGQPAEEVQEATESRANAQQPTPPAEIPLTETMSTPPPLSSQIPQANMQEDVALTRAKHDLEMRKENNRRIASYIRRSRQRRQEEAEDDEEEKALSDCDDEEWARRYPIAMENVKNPTPFIPKCNFDYEKWISGSSAMFVVRDIKHKDTATRNKGSPRMSSLNFTPGSFNSSTHLPALGARGLTDIGVIVAISASLDWYEKNPSSPAPTAAEMTSMLEKFARSKQTQAKQPQAPNPIPQQTSQNPVTDDPLKSPKRSADDEASSPSQSERDQTLVNDEEEIEAGHDGDIGTNIEDNRVDPTEPQTPPEQQQPETARTWATALSASVIGSVLRKPVNWFTRRDHARQNVPATEPRPVKAKMNSARSAMPRNRLRHHDTPAHSSKALPAKTSPSPSASPTPASRQPPRGRPDSHLPVHLRGVRYEDLPSEWQAVSQHMKRAEPAPVEDEDEPVDFAALLEIAKKTRAERDLKEKADRLALERKRSATSSGERVRSAKLGHSTYGIPADMDESSSSEEDTQTKDTPKKAATHDGLDQMAVLHNVPFMIEMLHPRKVA